MLDDKGRLFKHAILGELCRLAGPKWLPDYYRCVRAFDLVYGDTILSVEPPDSVADFGDVLEVKSLCAAMRAKDAEIEVRRRSGEPISWSEAQAEGAISCIGAKTTSIPVEAIRAVVRLEQAEISGLDR